MRPGLFVLRVCCATVSRSPARRFSLLLTTFVLIWWDAPPSFALEGKTAAGPTGGTDMRSALLPPPGLYGGLIGAGGDAPKLVDGHGHDIPALIDAHFTIKVATPFFVYVPDVQLLGGSVGLLGVFPTGADCGRLFGSTPWRCSWGAGDPYFEVAWSRYLGTMRMSHVPGSLPILEGLAISFGLGAVVPIGKYNVELATTQGISPGNNTFDVAPSFALTYTTPPIIAEGTEFSAKAYWNNYRTNPATHYHAGDLIDIDFGITERYGRFQLGIAGFYAFQIEDDTQYGIRIPPDGRRAEVLQLGGVMVHDMPEYATSLKIKALTSVWSANAVRSQTIVVGFFKKFN